MRSEMYIQGWFLPNILGVFQDMLFVITSFFMGKKSATP